VRIDNLLLAPAMGTKRSKKSQSFSPSILLAFIFLILLLLVIAILKFGTVPSIFGDQVFGRNGMDTKQEVLLKRYEAVVERARSLSLRYRNVTGVAHPLESDLMRESSNDRSLGNRSNSPPGIQSIVIGNHLNVQSSKDPTSATGNFALKDLVLGMAQDTDPKNFVVFASSLRKNSNADIVVFVNNPAPPRHREIASENNIKLVTFDLSMLTREMQTFHPSTLRWPLFYKYLQDVNVRKQYRRIWMIDVRDSFFQSDPFNMLPVGQNGFLVFQGVESISIKECGWNSGWIKDCFGTSILSEVGNANIICSGVSMGDAKSVFEYLTLMEDIIMTRGKSVLSKHARFPRCERNGVDQGIHNVLVHKNLIPNLRIFAQSNGPVANLQAQKSRIKEGEVFNQNGDIVPVVHQYDRRPDLQKSLFSKYVSWIDTNDEKAEWNAEEACKMYTPKVDTDLFKGVCDMKSQGGATSAASCCSFCEKRPGCKAFTYYSSVCFLKSCSDSARAASLPGAVSASRRSMV